MGCCRTPAGSHSPSTASGRSALATSAQPIAMLPAAPAAQVYFTAGPNHGPRLFGYLAAVSFRVDRRECSVIVTADSQRCRGGMRHPKTSTVQSLRLGTAVARCAPEIFTRASISADLPEHRRSGSEDIIEKGGSHEIVLVGSQEEEESPRFLKNGMVRREQHLGYGSACERTHPR